MLMLDSNNRSYFEIQKPPVYHSKLVYQHFTATLLSNHSKHDHHPEEYFWHILS